MRLGCCGLKSCSLGIGIFSHGLFCWAGKAAGANRKMAKHIAKNRLPEGRPSGAEALLILLVLTARLKSCPVTKRDALSARLKLRPSKSNKLCTLIARLRLSVLPLLEP